MSQYDNVHKKGEEKLLKYQNITSRVTNQRPIDTYCDKQTQFKQSTNTYYPIQDQVQYVQSRIVSERNSTLMSNINNSIGNHNRVSAFQLSAQYHNNDDQQQRELQLQLQNQRNYNQKNNSSTLLQQQSNIMKPNVINNNNSKLSLQSYQQPLRTHKLQIVSDNQSNLSNKNSQSSSLNKRSVSINRGGIRVVSRNSSIEKKSQTSSIEKSIKNNNNYDNSRQQQHKQIKKDNHNSLTGMCGLNCNTRSPFIQAQQNNQLTLIPNLGSIQTLTSQLIDNKQMMSDRINYKINSKNQSLVLGKNLPTNSSQMTSIQQQSAGYMTGGQSIQKVYKHLRQMMEKQLMVSKKMYQKKCIDEMESMNLLYQSQIQTLQKVLAENQTLIEHQERKIQKLSDKCTKQHDKINSYNQRLQSINKYIQSTNKFAIQRVNETQKKFTLLLSQLQELNLTQKSSSVYMNKLQHLQSIFTTMIAQTVIKYRSIQTQLKQQVKDMMKKYDYFEQKIYQMDLMKHLGKENQIQNYKLIEKVQSIKEQISLIEKKHNIKTQVTMYKSTIQGINELKNIKQFNQLKSTLYKLQAQSQFWQKNQQQTFSTINKLQVDKHRLTNKINQLRQQLSRKQQQIQKVKQQKYKLNTQKTQYINQKQEKLLKQGQKQKWQLKPQQIQKWQLKSGQKTIQCQQKQNLLSTDKKSFYQSQQQTNNNKLNKQIQRLHQIIDQYDCKIQQLHVALQQLQLQNVNLQQQLNKSTIQEKKNKSQSTYQQSTINTINKLNTIIQEKQTQLQQTINDLQQTNKQKQQLNHALQMTQHIFDKQIQKFKSTIQKLQQENQQLLYQLNDLRQSQYNIAESSSSKLSSLSKNNYQNNKKIVSSKSPKKQLCETVTMGWFKKNIQQIQNSKPQSNKKVLIRQVVSPQRNSNYTNNQQAHNENSFSLSGSKDQFFYPVQNHHSRQQSYESIQTSRSHQSNPQHTQAGSKRKIQGQQHYFNQVKHSQSLPNGYIENKTRVTNKLEILHQALIQGNHQCPVQCILDNEGRLQLSNTGKYIVDRNYTTFQLSHQQLITAQQLGLINLIDDDLNIQLNEQQQQQQQQSEHYIF